MGFDSLERTQKLEIKINCMRNLKLYNLNTPLDFGMYNGNRLANVFDESTEYIFWCLTNVAWFVIDQAEFNEELPEIKWSLTFREAAKKKWSQYIADEITSDVDDYEHDSYGEYVGTYAQDVERLSDNFINDVLGGEADAYWNID